jgi:3-hydroxyisobutyrate dehydrogenase-like beta-hydroxyacid dehydrogenase
MPPKKDGLLRRFAPRNDENKGKIIMDIGFIGLGKMGFPMARNLIEAGHKLIVHDQRKEAVDKLVALGAVAASSPKDVADRVETVMASLPSLQASL